MARGLCGAFTVVQSTWLFVQCSARLLACCVLSFLGLLVTSGSSALLFSAAQHAIKPLSVLVWQDSMPPSQCWCWCGLENKHNNMYASAIAAVVRVLTVVPKALVPNTAQASCLVAGSLNTLPKPFPVSSASKVFCPLCLSCSCRTVTCHTGFLLIDLGEQFVAACALPRFGSGRAWHCCRSMHECVLSVTHCATLACPVLWGAAATA